MNKNNPTVYIVLTVYNGEKYFLEQLMSIYFQEYENWFLIIVDDGSTDSSLKIAKKFVDDYKLENKVKIIHQENQGTCKATEHGLIEVQKLGNKDDYVTYCDADDIWTRNKLGYLVEYMNNHKDCDLCFHDMAITNQDGKIISKSFLYSKQFQYANLNRNTFFELATYNHISINLIYKVLYIDDIIPIQNEGAKDYRTALIFALNNKKIKYFDESLGYYRRGQQSIQKTLNSKGILRPKERDLNMLNKLKEKFPNNKEIDYFINYRLFMIKGIKNGHTKRTIILSWICYPKRFFQVIRNGINYYINGEYKKS